MPTARFVAMTHYLLGPILTLCLWVGLLNLTWGADSGDVGAVVAALLVALILTLPAALCVGLVWNLATWLHDRWWDYQWWRRHR